VTLADASVSAQDKKGSKADYKLTIFDDEQLKGRSVIIRQALPDLAPLKFNDKSESIEWHAPPGKALVVCAEKNFERPVLVLVGQGDVKDLGKEQRNALHSIRSVALLTCPKGRLPKGIPKDIPKLGSDE
jgi:hypothetical protein